MEHFDERHYVTPRGDRTPGKLRGKHDGQDLELSPLGWWIVAAIFAFCLTMLWVTDCAGNVMCS